MQRGQKVPRLSLRFSLLSCASKSQFKINHPYQSSHDSPIIETSEEEKIKEIEFQQRQRFSHTHRPPHFCPIVLATNSGSGIPTVTDMTLKLTKSLRVGNSPGGQTVYTLIGHNPSKKSIMTNFLPNQLSPLPF